MSSSSRYLLDSSIWIDAIVGDTLIARAVQPLFDDAEKGQLQLLVSEVSVAEISRLDGGPDVREMVDSFLANKYILRLPTTAAVSSKASSLIAEYALETCDAIIIATAMVHDAYVAYTHDGKMRKKIRKRHSVPSDAATEIEGLKIRSPLFDRELCERAGITDEELNAYLRTREFHVEGPVAEEPVSGEHAASTASDVNESK